MENTLKFIALSLVFCFISRFRRDLERDGWVRIRSKAFHDIFFWGGYWQYRPCNIVLAVVGEISFVVGVCLIPFHLPEKLIQVLLAIYIVVVTLALIVSMIYECYIIHKRKKEADLVSSYIKSMRRNKKWK